MLAEFRHSETGTDQAAQLPHTSLKNGANQTAGALHPKTGTGGDGLAEATSQEAQPEPGRVYRQGLAAAVRFYPLSAYLAAPMRKTLVPQVGQVPWVAGLPFFMVIAWGLLISLFSRHLTQ